MTDLLELGVAAARAAGALLLDRFGAAASGVGTKSSATDLVSDADRDAERVIVGTIRSERPGDGVLAEEGGEVSGSGLRWVVDPLDGTVNYLFGIPHWAVSIAVEDSDGALAGVVLDVCRDETFTAVRGEGAWLNGSRMRVNEPDGLAHALVATGFSYDPDVRTAQARVFGSLAARIRDFRRAGTASLDLAWTACGRLDAFYESGLHAWDLAAGALLVREAGGVVTERLIAGRDGVVAGHRSVHAALDALLPSE